MARLYGPDIHDSVDADDNSIDGSGLQGDTFFGSGQGGITFTFNTGILGTLPTHAGIVWTDGAGDVTFQAFGPGDILLGTTTSGSFPDAFVTGETAEDRFSGVNDAGGILRIFITNTGSALEVDHLQYGRLSAVAAVPEPGTFTLVGLGMIGLFGYRWRRKQAPEGASHSAC